MALTNLILGQAFRYNYEQLAPFVTSLARTGFSGETVLFVNRVPEPALEKLRTRGVRVVPFSYRCGDVRNTAHVAWPYLRWLRRLGLPFSMKKRLLRPLVNIPWVRMLLYYDFLRREPDHYGQVMLTDVRDVLFQADPFTRATGPCLRLFLEDRSMHVGTSQANIRWITDLFGPAVLAEMAERPISCSGTVIGDRASILAYLRAFIETAFTVRSTYLNGGDQGIHNFMIHRRLLPPFQLLENGESEVLTLGYAKLNAGIVTDSDGLLVDSAGRPFNVLHQYDRHPELAARLLAREQAA